MGSMKGKDMPIGFAMALTQNPDAMRKFALLSDAQKQEIISGTRSIHSRDEMHRYVMNLLND